MQVRLRAAVPARAGFQVRPGGPKGYGARAEGACGVSQAGELRFSRRVQIAAHQVRWKDHLDPGRPPSAAFLCSPLAPWDWTGRVDRTAGSVFSGAGR